MPAKFRGLRTLRHLQPRHHSVTPRSRESESRQYHQKSFQGRTRNPSQPARLQTLACGLAAGCKPPLWCLTKCGDWRYSSCCSCSCITTRRRLPHVTNFTRTARSKRRRSQSCPCPDRGYAPGISERDVRKVWKADLSLCQVRIARTRSELAFDADRG